MGKRKLLSAAVGCFRALLLLSLVSRGPPPASPSDALRNLSALTYPYSSILSPLLKALSEHEGSRWSLDVRKGAKPEHRYVKYLTEVYKKSARTQRGDEVYNTVRLIKPQEECPAQSNKETFSQDLSYSLDQVRRKEQLLKSSLLYSFNLNNLAAVSSVCYLSIKEHEQSNQCQLCAGISHTLNLTDNTHKRRRRNWVEVDVTLFLRPVQKRNVGFLVNISCPEEQRAGRNGFRSPLGFTLRSPSLILYLNDTSKVAHQRSLASSSADVRSPTALDTFQKQVFKSAQRHGQNKRWKRASPKSKRGDKSFDMQLPELKSSSEFPTTDCALYDFRVRFSQLKLDHWIVFPPKYNPRYCRGICPRTMGFIYGSPVHTMVQNIIYEKLDSSVPRPSCVPSHYSPLSVMIFEEDGSYAYKEFKDMVATRCTCR
ncbi:growth/differentiation factor 9 [Poeciliopsis prolifica]|uniref:growth/differentiation factor 9 n=1 Tax=Poeciliopsis prolifica TaxID=188132 RepID=UPI002413A16A|nr:growth/differentiation factor 9 [Poeciliopsis prolifica]